LNRRFQKSALSAGRNVRLLSSLAPTDGPLVVVWFDDGVEQRRQHADRLGVVARPVEMEVGDGVRGLDAADENVQEPEGAVEVDELEQ
jgi:hypothetical protein